MPLVIEVLNGDRAAITRAMEPQPVQAPAGDSIAVVTELVSKLDQALLYAPRALQYARDPNDAMRVSVMNQASIRGVNSVSFIAAQLPFGDGGNVPGWYSQFAGTSMDPREQQKLMSEIQMHNIRTQRWVFT